MITDILDRPINVEDYVVFYSALYQVVKLGKARKNGTGSVKIQLVNNGTSKPVIKMSKLLCVVDKNDVLIWMLKK